MGDAKFKLEDILNKQKAPPQILDLANIDIQTDEEYLAIIEKIPDYKIKPEKTQETQTQIKALAESIREYKTMRKKLSEMERQKGPDGDEDPEEQRSFVTMSVGFFILDIILLSFFYFAMN